ncbi:Putative pentatricopeptide repeat-containing protein [Apostasia shenzhenica]|uniref:Pentatricopeptide repeat-containing protein n=1 Tax=Apostasia shenzhenica TaxID=1088818 RepID=A0A2I0B577_9ASPA|nr:Putative pentatricopeptide repeat-containing protein [Apostasia shenzhenica]
MLYPSIPTVPLPPFPSLAAVLRLLRRETAGGGSLLLTKQAHARAIVFGLHHHPLISSRLVTAYSLFGLPALSRLAFCDSASRNVLLWNSLLAALSHNASPREVLATFHRMRVCSHEPPDGYTLALVAKASSEIGDARIGRGVHALVEILGFGSDTVLGNTLMAMYFKCLRPNDARQVFDEIPVRSVASWNALILEHVNAGGTEHWELVREMQSEGFELDGFTFSTLLPLCAEGYAATDDLGRQLHCYILRHNVGMGSKLHIGSSLIKMYCNGGRTAAGRSVFDHELQRNVFTWTAMIAGYVENGDFREAIRLCHSMHSVDGIMPNEVTLVTILPAVGSLARLDFGKQIHGFASRRCSNSQSSLNNALIDMYSKCGSLATARHVFDDESWHKDGISWSSMISCHGIHGEGNEALKLFEKMCSLGIKLNHVNILGVLSACSRAGLVKEGMQIYSSLVGSHGFIPSSEIFSCMVDMLGRAGKLEEALDFIDSMSFEPKPSVWSSLFRAAVTHCNRDVQHLASEFLIHSEPENPSHYVSLSNLHASCGRWDGVELVRKSMEVKGLRKAPGLSWIDVNGMAHSFYVADKSHLCTEMIYKAVDCLSQEMKVACNCPVLDNEQMKREARTIQSDHRVSLTRLPGQANRLT